MELGVRMSEGGVAVCVHVAEHLVEAREEHRSPSILFHLVML